MATLVTCFLLSHFFLYIILYFMSCILMFGISSYSQPRCNTSNVTCQCQGCFYTRHSPTQVSYEISKGGSTGKSVLSLDCDNLCRVPGQFGNAAVLGLPQLICHQVTDTGIPTEQAISRQKLRPGSGVLNVEITTDGPTRVFTICDIKENASSNNNNTNSLSIRNMIKANSSAKLEELYQRDKEQHIIVQLHSVGISLVSKHPAQELLYVHLSAIVGEVLRNKKVNKLCLSIDDIQMDNQIFETPIPIFMYVTPIAGKTGDDGSSKLPAIEVRIEMQHILNENAVIFNHLIIRMKRITVHLEERLLLKLFEFVSYTTSDEQLYSTDENDYETQRMLTEVSAGDAKRFYFGIIQLVPDQIRLSMKTASKLPATLKSIKKKLGLTFIKFEDAGVDLEPYIRQHPFETMQFLIHSIVKHFKDELIWQAGIILGSVDFLGNPLGFMNDVTEGVSGLIYEGNVGALVKNVAHGISNSTAKVTESLSDGLGKVAMDDEHEEMRQKIRQVESGSSKDHLVAGIKGLGFGILGGATGIFKQVYEGASNEGIHGIFSGIGKGLVGAVTKPVVGVLDLASETARAVRDSSRSSSRIVPERKRLPRCVIGSGGLLPRYSPKQSLGQQFLYSVNDRYFNEQLVAYESLRTGSEDLRVIISNLYVRIVTSANSNNLTTVIESKLSELKYCKVIQEPEGGEMRYYIELTVPVTGSNASAVYQEPVKKPKVRCDCFDVAQIVSRQINYAKRLYDESRHTLRSDNILE